MLIAEGYAAAAPTLKRALRASVSSQPLRASVMENISTEQGVRWLWLGVFAAEVRWDDESWDLLSARHVQLARDAGALGVLPVALSQRAALHLLEGDFAAATSLIDEAEIPPDRLSRSEIGFGWWPVGIPSLRLRACTR